MIRRQYRKTGVGVIAVWLGLAAALGLGFHAQATYAGSSDAGSSEPTEEGVTAEGQTASHMAIPEDSKEELRARLQAHRVDTKASRPGVTAYLADVGHRLSKLGDSWLSGRLGGLDPRLGDWITQGTRFLVIVAAVLLVVLLVRRYADRPWQVPTNTLSEPLPAPPEELGAGHWQGRIEESMSRGDAPAALEALWWWWACRLQAREVDPSWTTRELLQAVGRDDLRALGRAFDVLVYGTEGASIQEVGSLWQRLRGAEPGIESDPIPEPT